MGYQFAFDPANKILLLRIDERLTDTLARALYWEVRKQSIATDASAAIYDLSAITEFAVSPEFIRDLVSRDPAMPQPHALAVSLPLPCLDSLCLVCVRSW